MACRRTSAECRPIRRVSWLRGGRGVNFPHRVRVFSNADAEQLLRPTAADGPKIPTDPFDLILAAPSDDPEREQHDGLDVLREENRRGLHAFEGAL